MSNDEQDESTKPEDYGPDCDSGSCEVRIVGHPVLRNSERADDVFLDPPSDQKEVEEAADGGGGKGKKRGRNDESSGRKRNDRVRSRAFVGTLNNPTPSEIAYYRNVGLEDISWLIVGEEVGEKGTPHLQMACRFRYQVSISTARSMFGQNKAHIEVMKGTVEENVVYCSKDNKFFERGIRPVDRGKENKNKLDGMVKQIKEGKPDVEIFESNPAMYLRYRSAIGAAKQLYQGVAKRNPVEVFWYYGETGAGKSYRAEQEASNDGRGLYRQNGSEWWDGYDGQPLVIIDDFEETARFRATLRILDQYNVLIPVKGSHVWFRAEKIWVTASYHPRKIDQGGQIERRCKTIVEMYVKDRPDIRSMMVPIVKSYDDVKDLMSTDE